MFDSLIFTFLVEFTTEVAINNKLHTKLGVAKFLLFFKYYLQIK